MFEQLKKNTVSAVNQLKVNERVRFYNPDGKGIRILIAGNSITLHGYNEDYWKADWGMAASAPEKDYVHVLMEKVRTVHPDAVFCVFQIAPWEVHYKDSELSNSYLNDLTDYNPDITVVRVIENCPHDGFDGEIFKKAYDALVKRVSENGKTVITDGFWRHPGDPLIRQVAEENGYAFATLGDLGDDEAMRAVGLFEHAGVAAHPGDAGMAAIADRIFEAMKPLL